MRFSSLILLNLLRRPLRSALAVTGVAVGVAAVVALVGVARDFEDSLRGVYESRGVDLMVIRAGSMQRFSSVLDQPFGGDIRRLPGVREVFPTLMEVVSFEGDNVVGVVVQGLPRDRGPLREYRMESGRRIERDDRRAIMLGKVLARNLDKKVGDSIEVTPGEPFRVVGIYDTFNVFENGSIVMALDELQPLIGRQGEVTYFTVTSDRKDKQSLESLRKAIEGLKPGIAALATREYIDTSVEIRMARASAWLTSTLALLVGAVGMINTMLTAVFERTAEIALLRAVGWRKHRVLTMILLESVVLCLAGAIAGTVLSILLTQLLAQMPAAERMVSGRVDPGVILQGFLLALLVGVIGGLYPALRAARLDPTAGLRKE
jgi:putative ABC transport system permease protein